MKTRLKNLNSVISIVLCSLVFFGLSVASSADITPVSERTTEVQAAIVTATGANSASDVTEDDLKAITELNLRSNGITELKSGDFSGMSGLTNLNLYGNSLESLPDDIFDGLTSLTTLRLGRNTVDPMPIIISLEKVDENQFKAVAPTGAPFNIIVPISVNNGTIINNTTSLTISTGTVESSTVTVTRTAGTTAAVTADIGTLPSIPNLNHYGYELSKSDSLPLHVLSSPDPTQEEVTDNPDVNDPPVFHEGASTTRTVDENIGSGDIIGDPIIAVDPEDEEVTYSISGTDATSFTIDTDSGQLKPNQTLDYETKSSYSVTITAKDPSELSDTIDVTINVNDVNEAPVFSSESPTRSVAENTAAGVNIGSAVAATDPEGDTVTYSLGGTDAASFDIVTTSGQLQTKAALDHETKKTYAVSITAKDADGAAHTINVTINVTNVVEPSDNVAPEFTDGTSTTRSVAENTAASVNIGSAVSATDDDEDTLSYSLSGTDAASFDIVSTSGQLQTKAALDYETKTSYSVTITAKDPDELSDTISVTINVTDVNEAPVYASNSITLTIAENTAASVNIGSVVSATDDDGDTLSYSLSGTDAASFDIVSTSGQLQTKAALDYETKTSYSVTITAKDPDELSDTISVTINVTDVNEAPVYASNSITLTIAENTAASVNIGSAVSATDDDGDTLTYTLGGTDATSFDIVNSSGQIQTKTSLDYETKRTYSVTVTATDGDDSSDTTNVTINVTNVVEADENVPPIFTEGSDTTRSIAENTTSGQNIGSAVFAIDDNDDTLTYTLGGTDAASFDIVSTTGQLQTKTSLDYETKNIYTITITASDGSLTDTIDVTVGVTNVHEAGINNYPTFNDGIRTTRSVRENTDAEKSIGAALTATDSDGDTLEYSMSGADSSAFSIDSTTGQLSTNSAIDYEMQNTYSLTVTVTDSKNGSVSISVKINIIDVFESTPLSERTGVVRSAIIEAIDGVSTASEVRDTQLAAITTLRIAATPITTLKNGDFDGLSSLTELGVQFNRSLRTVPEDLFKGLTLLKTLRLSTNNSLESIPADLFDGLTSLEKLGLHANALTSLPEDIFDGLSSLKELELSQNQITSLPVDVFDGLTSLEYLVLFRNKLTSLPADVFDGLSKLGTLNLSSNQLTSIPVGLFEGLTSLISLEIHQGTALQITVSLVKVQDGEFKATVDTGAPFDLVLPVSVTNGSIDGETTSITIKTGKLESDTTLTVTRETETTGSVDVDIGTLPIPPKDEHDGYSLVTSNLLPLSVIPAIEEASNTAPTFTDGASTTRSVAENTASGQNIGSVVAATDAEDDTLTYTLSGTDSSSFTIDSSSGQIQTSSALDYETKSSYSVIVTATDPDGLSDIINVTISITDVNEVVAPAAPEFTEGTSATRTVAENTAASQNIGDAVSATDANEDTLTYSLSGTDAASFDIDTTDGQIKTKASLNYETKSSYSVVVTASDENLSDTINIAINVNDANDAPVFANESITRSIAENTAANTNIGEPVSATDEDEDTLTYTLGGTDAASFDIDSTNGQLKTKASLDYESKTSYSVTITAKDGDDASDSINVTINITDVEEAATQNAPVFTEGESVTRTVAENTAAAQNIGDAVSATDADENTLTYSLSGTDAASFGIVSTTGQLQTKGNLNYETKKSYSVVVTVSDGSLSDTINITINVTDVNDAPAFAADSATRSIAENTAADTNIGEPVSATDEDEDTLTYTLAGTDAASFDIGSIDGQLKTKAALNYETKKSYAVVVTASDETLSDTINITINVTDVNEAPVFAADSATRSIAENTAANTTIGDPVSAKDADEVTLTYALSGTDAALFDIGSTDGQIKTKAALNYETKKSYSVVVTASDGSLSDTINITINVTDANDAPVFAADSATRSIAENTAANTNIGEPVSATDEDEDTLTYTLGGTDAASFDIDSTNGQLKTKASLDYESKTSHSVSITAKDADNASDSINVTINITNVEEAATQNAPVFTEGESVTRTVAENTAAAQNIGDVVSATDADEDTLTYALSGTDAASFGIVSTTGQLQTKGNLNYETKKSYSVVVTASDGSLSDTINITINVTDVNDAPAFAADSATRSIAENTAADTNIGDPVSATDEDEDTLTYTLGGTDTASFDIDSTDGQLKTKASLDYGTKKSYSVVVTASDGSLSDTINITIKVTNVNEAPAFAADSATRSIAENTAADTNIGDPVSATDADEDTLAYALSGTDAASFDIDTTNGQIKTKVALNYETKKSYAVVVTASDETLSDTINITINVSDVNDAPVFADDSTTRSIAENTDADTNIGDPISATDEDEDTLTYTLAGTDAASFDINSTDGQLKTKASLDFETKSSYAVTVTAKDGDDASDSINVTINITDVEEVVATAPVFTEGESATRTVAENTAAAQNIGDAVSATDADEDTLAYALSGTDAASFDIDTTNGQIKTKVALNYENKKSYAVVVTASDENLSDTINITINVTDVNEAPAFAAESATRSIAENTDADTNIGDPVSATDEDEDTLTYTLGGTDEASFDIGSTDGQLKTKAALNYETKSSYSVVVTASDENLSDTINITINVTDVNEAPAFAAESATRSIAENTDADTNIGDPISATDEDEDTLTYTLGGTDEASFDIGSTDGQLKTKASLDYETKSSYAVTVTAKDGDDASDTINVTINITDVEEVVANAPEFTEGESATRTVAENTATAQNIGTAVAATDADEDTLTYALSGTDAASFDIDTTNGQIKTKAALNYETKSSYAVVVTASDETLSDTINITINVSDANDAPVFANDSTTLSIDENTDADTNIGDPITATDEDGDDLTYTLGGTDANNFDLVEDSGQLRTSGFLDYETKTSYALTITATDPDNSTDTIDVTVNVNDVTDVNPPIFLDIDTDNLTLSVDENTPANTSIGDPFGVRGIRPITFSLRGTDANRFRIGRTSGQLRTRAALDYESKKSYSIRVVATNSDGNKSIDVTIQVTDVFESVPLSQRPAKVRNAIVAAINGVNKASDVTDAHMLSIKTLDLSDKSLSEITSNHLDGLTSLEELNLSDNSFTSLHVDLFDSFSSLTKLHLDNNNLHTLPSDLFDGLSLLKELHLNHNFITGLPSGIFDDLSSLKKLNLHYNTISSLSSSVFQELSSLTHLNFENNLLQRLPNDIFKGLTSINTIKAANNRTTLLNMTVSLNKLSETKFTAEVNTGIPYQLDVPVTVTIGHDEISYTLGIKKGATQSEQEIEFALSPTSVSVNIDDLAVVPSRFTGLSLVKSSNLPITLNPPNQIIFGAPTNSQPIPDFTSFNQNYPNPFNPETWIPYQLSEASDVTMTIYNMRGVVVRELALGHQPAGYYQSRARAAYWNGRNSLGEMVATGVYFVTFKAGDFTATRKMMIRK